MKVRDNTIVLFYVFGFFFSNNGCNFDLNNYNDRLDTDTFYGPPQGPYKGRLTVLLLRFFMSLFFCCQISGRYWNRHAGCSGNEHVWSNYVCKSNICVIKKCI